MFMVAYCGTQQWFDCIELAKLFCDAHCIGYSRIIAA